MSSQDKIATQALLTDIKKMRKNFNNKAKAVKIVKESFNDFFYILSKYKVRLENIYPNIDEDTKLKNRKIYEDWNDKFEVFWIFNFNLYLSIKAILIMIFSNMINAYGVLIRSTIESIVLSHWFIININELDKWADKTSYPITGKNGVIAKISDKELIQKFIGDKLTIQIDKKYYDDLVEHYRDYSGFTHGKISIFMDMLEIFRDKTKKQAEKEVNNLFKQVTPTILMAMPAFFDIYLILITYNAYILSMSTLFNKKDFREDIKIKFKYFPRTTKVFSNIFTCE